LNKEGIGTLIALLVVAVVLTALAVLMPKLYAVLYAGIAWVLVGFTVYFFRDPEREIPEGEGVVVAPADGKIIEISETFEREFLKSSAYKVSIFLSVFDVHVNRIPVSGRISYFRYRRGAFHAAFRETASFENEQSVIGIETEGGKVLVKQIAGIIARRIVCNVREGYEVRRGERFGMIKFGSRVDLFLPKDTRLQVELHQKVKAGTTIIGVMAHD
jgi:phosphatidylserine decarboxylase